MPVRTCSRAVKVLSVAALVGGAFVAGYAVAAQPHMINALHALENARSELQVAEHNKGGHRVEALELVNRAINHVQLGIEAGR
jgi:hypothetical protein